MRAGELRDRIRIERPVADDSHDGAGSGSWMPIAHVRANIQDALPSRGDRLADGISIATRPARVRIRYRGDVRKGMRIVVLIGDDVARIASIVTPAAIVGRRRWVEFMIEDYDPAGNRA